MSKSDFVLVILILMVLFIAPFGFELHCRSYAIAPLIGAALISSGASMANGVLNNIVNRSNMRLQADISKELMNYQWNKFQSPAAQVRAYGQAGINPAVALGPSGPGQFSGPSVNMPTAVPSSFDFGGLASDIQAIAMAKKTGLEAIGQDLKNQLDARTLEDNVKLVTQNLNYTAEQTNYVMKQASQIEGLNTKIQEEIDILRKNKVKLDFDNQHLQDYFYAAMRHYADQHNIDEQTFNQMKEQAPEILEKLKAEKRILNVQADIEEDFKRTKETLGVAGQIGGFILQFLKFLK